MRLAWPGNRFHQGYRADGTEPLWQQRIPALDRSMDNELIVDLSTIARDR
jgi:hypothetical protein